MNPIVPIATVLVASMLAACDVSDAVPGDADALDAAETRTLEIVDNLRQAGYPDEAIEIDEDGAVIVGGDAVVSLGASRELIGLTRTGEERENAPRQYRATNVIDAAIAEICVDGSALSSYPVLSAGLDAAIANYNGQNLSFDMVRTTGSSEGCDATIVAKTKSGTGGRSGFPVGGLPYEQVEIGTGVSSQGLAVATHVITHELGHCIGLRHTDYYNRCGFGDDEGQGSNGAHHIPNTPLGVVPGSLMNACYGASSTGVWHPEDLDALHQLYGRDCCEVGGGAGCGNVLVNECVGAEDPFCNDDTWDELCVSEVESLGCGSCLFSVEHGCCTTGGAGCSDNVIEAAVCAAAGYYGDGEVDPYCCNVAWDALCVLEVNALDDDVALPCGSNCCSPKGSPGCSDASVQACVGAEDPYCTGVAWDGLCVAWVEILGCSRCA
jgi:hypothetical protein